MLWISQDGLAQQPTITQIGISALRSFAESRAEFSASSLVSSTNWVQRDAQYTRLPVLSFETVLAGHAISFEASEEKLNANGTFEQYRCLFGLCAWTPLDVIDPATSPKYLGYRSSWLRVSKETLSLKTANHRAYGMLKLGFVLLNFQLDARDGSESIDKDRLIGLPSADLIFGYRLQRRNLIELSYQASALRSPRANILDHSVGLQFKSERTADLTLSAGLSRRILSIHYQDSSLESEIRISQPLFKLAASYKF